MLRINPLRHGSRQRRIPCMLPVLATLIAGAATASCGAADEDAAETEAPIDIPPGTAQISPYAGTGSPRFKGDGGPAAEAGFYAPQDLSLDSHGNLFIATDHRIRKVDAATGIITTVAGTGRNRFSGDGGPATSGELAEPRGIMVDGQGNIFIADTENHRVRKVDGATGTLSTVAGIGRHISCRHSSYGGPCVDTYRPTEGAGYSGDGGPATGAELSQPTGVAVDALGNLFIAEGKVRVRKVDGATGVITTFASGKITESYETGKIQVHTEAVGNIVSIARNDNGLLFLADYKNNVVHKVSAPATP